MPSLTSQGNIHSDTNEECLVFTAKLCLFFMHEHTALMASGTVLRIRKSNLMQYRHPQAKVCTAT